MPIILFLITILSRLPFTSRYLYHMDSGHFSLALTNYDLVLHQPHPPGYVLYVMLGKLGHLFLPDPNSPFVLLGILFSAGTVVLIYYLAKEMFNEKAGTLAALLAAASPNFWFHGEVALSYTTEAFFSALTGLLCWRACRGRQGSGIASASVLALAGGFRQNTPAFLFPLWLYSVKNGSFRTFCLSLGIFLLIILSWFLPMVYMTGGTDAYLAAFRELWLFNTGHNSVFEKGFIHLKTNLQYLYTFLFYSLGAVLPFLPVALYAVLRSGKLSGLRDSRASFLACWMLPPLLFHLLIFISGNPGYILIILPPLVILASVSLCYIRSELLKMTGKDLYYLLLFSLVTINSWMFVYGKFPVSYSDIRTHDTEIHALLTNLAQFDHRTTALFIKPDSFYSYRHLMVYLPRFTVYQVDVRTSPGGEQRKQFGGTGGNTFLTATISPPSGIRYFAAVITDSRQSQSYIPPQCTEVRIAPNLLIVSGPIAKICEIYPELRPQWNPGRPSNTCFGPDTSNTCRMVSIGKETEIP